MVAASYGMISANIMRVILTENEKIYFLDDFDKSSRKLATEIIVSVA